MNTSAYPSTNTPKTPHQSPPTQCQGFTRSTRTRCTRTTPSKSQIPYRCHQHQEEDVDCGEYTEWIDETLSHYTKKRLIDELVKPVSDKDGPGYIYVYQLMEGDGVLDGSMYKIGRTTNISRRLTQWSTRCGLTPHLIAHFYTTPYAHRAERLIHIELSERFGTGPVVCPGRCREAHYEWFRISERVCRREGGWEVMRGVIDKWVKFIREMGGKDVREVEIDGTDEALDLLTSSLACMCIQDPAYDTSNLLTADDETTDEEWHDAETHLPHSHATQRYPITTRRHASTKTTQPTTLHDFDSWENLLPKKKSRPF